MKWRKLTCPPKTNYFNAKLHRTQPSFLKGYNSFWGSRTPFVDSPNWKLLKSTIRMSKNSSPKTRYFQLPKKKAANSYIVGGFNPFEKYARQIGSFPQVGVKIKNIWNHHRAIVFQRPVKTSYAPCVPSLWRLTVVKATTRREAESFSRTKVLNRWTPEAGGHGIFAYLDVPGRKWSDQWLGSMVYNLYL